MEYIIPMLYIQILERPSCVKWKWMEHDNGYSDGAFHSATVANVIENNIDINIISLLTFCQKDHLVGVLQDISLDDKFCTCRYSVIAINLIILKNTLHSMYLRQSYFVISIFKHFLSIRVDVIYLLAIYMHT